MKKKKVLVLIGTLACGGAERVASMLSNELSAYGYDVELMTYYDRSSAFYHLNNEVKNTSIMGHTKTKLFFKNFLFFRNYIKHNADIIISFTYKFNIFSFFSCLGLEKTIIVSERTDPKKKPKNFFLKILRYIVYNFSDGVVFQTLSAQNHFNKRIINKSIVIYNPFDNLDKTIIDDDVVSKNAKIISIGRLIDVKNQKMLIHSFAEIYKKYPQYKLYIFGEGILRNKLQELIIKKHLGECVFLPGNTNNIIKEIKSSQVFVLTSNYEGMSNSLIEAMCVGTAVISTDVECAKEIIANGYDGIIIKKNDCNALISSLDLLISNDEYRCFLENNSIKKNVFFKKEVIVKQWIDYLEKRCCK